MALVDDGSAAPATLAGGTVLLEALGAAAEAREAAVRDLVLALGEVVRAGVTERLEGLPVDVVLRVRQRWTDAEVAMLCDAADVLAAMPATRQWWAEGVLTWSMVRDVVAAVRPLGRDGRAAVDARLAASGDRLHEMSPSQVAWAVTDAVDEVRGPAEVRQRERAAREGSFLALLAPRRPPPGRPAAAPAPGSGPGRWSDSAVTPSVAQGTAEVSRGHAVPHGR